MKLRVAGITGDSIVDGPGLRLSVFAQGCPHGCPGCHNPSSHPFEGGQEADTGALARRALEDPLCAGVTLSGGEPFCQAEAMADLARRVRAGGKTVWTYTGYTYEQLQEGAGDHPAWHALLYESDVLIDGPFIQAQKSMDLRFRGSRNQRILLRREAGDGVVFAEAKE